MTKVSKIIGIDISKEKFDVCFSFQPCGYSSKTYTYNDEGISCFLNEVPADCICIMEATGIYHLRLAYALNKRGVYVSIVNPLSVKNFSRAVMCRTKDLENGGEMTDQNEYFNTRCILESINGIWRLRSVTATSTLDLRICRPFFV